MNGINGASSSNGTSKCEVRRDAASGETIVTNLSSMPVNSATELTRFLEQALPNRGNTTIMISTRVIYLTSPNGSLFMSSAVGKTACNDRSSRSHTVFQVKIKGRNRVSD